MIFHGLARKTKFFVLNLLLIIGVALSIKAYAQTNTFEQEKLTAQINGKIYWYYPTDAVSHYCKRVEFISGNKKLSINFLEQLKIKFDVEGSTVKVKINDQIDATVDIELLEKGMFSYTTDIEYLNICFSDIEPVEHHKKIVQIKKKQEELAVKNRKGVRIGMTTKQVREKTDWGQPDSINVTTNSSGTREQWVYGYGNYLYFRNGILESIQVRK